MRLRLLATMAAALALAAGAARATAADEPM
jgi:hypothetical protein